MICFPLAGDRKGEATILVCAVFPGKKGLTIKHTVFCQASAICCSPWTMLAFRLTRFADLVYELLDTKHKNVIREASNYMAVHCTRALPLAEVAEYVGH